MITISNLTIPVLLTGGLLVLFGRKLFWLASSLLGFFGGLMLVNRYFPNLDGTTHLIIAVALGIITAIVVVMVQKATVAIAGLGAGAYLGYTVLSFMELHVSFLTVVMIIAMALLGLLLALKLFNWALSIITSLLGALVLVQTMELSDTLGLVIMALICAIGVIVQSADRLAPSRKYMATANQAVVAPSAMPEPLMPVTVSTKPQSFGYIIPPDAAARPLSSQPAEVEQPEAYGYIIEPERDSAPGASLKREPSLRPAYLDRGRRPLVPQKYKSFRTTDTTS